MSKRILMLLAAILAMGLIAVGCGDDDDGDNGDTTVTTQEPSDDATAEDDADAPDEDADVSGEVDALVQAAVDACKQSVSVVPQLSNDVKSDLEALCEEAATGDVEDAQKASREVCIKIVEETVPAGDAQDQAIDACEATTAP